MATVTTTDSSHSTYHSHSWNENTTDSGLSNDFASVPTEADKSTTSDKNTFTDRSDEVENVQQNTQANHMASKNFGTSTTTPNDAGLAGVAEKLETQSPADHSGGRGLDDDDLLYSLSETSATQVPDSRRITTGLSAALMLVALNRSGRNAAGTNLTEETSVSWLTEANRRSTPVELMSEEMESEQVEKVFTQSTNAITTSSSYSGDDGLKPKYSTTRQLIGMRPAAVSYTHLTLPTKRIV